LEKSVGQDEDAKNQIQSIRTSLINIEKANIGVVKNFADQLITDHTGVNASLPSPPGSFIEQPRSKYALGLTQKWRQRVDAY